MIHRYSFPTEIKAKELINTLELKEGQTTSNLIDGIVVIGFEDKYEYDEETSESILIKKGETFNVNVWFKNTPPKEWDNFEVFPKTPNHN